MHSLITKQTEFFSNKECGPILAIDQTKYRDIFAGNVNDAIETFKLVQGIGNKKKVLKTNKHEPKSNKH